jgi:hypothetical protein
LRLVQLVRIKISHRDQQSKIAKEDLMYDDVLGTTAAGGTAAAGGAAATGALPFTGYGITIAGLTITLSWVLAFALLAVAVGVLLIRWEAARD